MNNHHSLASMKTRLPIAENDNAPQYGYTAWAFYAGRTILAGKGLPVTATLVLVAFAEHAQAALSSGSGYWATTVTDIVNLTGLSASTVRTHAKSLVRVGALYEHLDGYRIPENVDHRWAF